MINFYFSKADGEDANNSESMGKEESKKAAAARESPRFSSEGSNQYDDESGWEEKKIGAKRFDSEE